MSFLKTTRFSRWNSTMSLIIFSYMNDYKVIEAENGKDALDRVKKESLINKIDLVISDIVMPEMNGEDLADALRKLRPDLKILLCSGFTDTRISAGRKSKRKDYHFLPKPYSLNKLEKTIRSILKDGKS